MSDARLETLRRKLTGDLEAQISAAVAAGAAPRVLLEGLSQPALERLGRGGAPLESIPAPIAALEAIVQRFGRPPLVVHNNKVVLEPLTDFPAGTDAKIRKVEAWAGSVGRIEFANHSMSWGGTGWVAAQTGGISLVITNRHVAKLVCRRKADGSGVFVRSPSGALYGAAIDFLEEADNRDRGRTAAIATVEYLADDQSADVAILKVEAPEFQMPTPFRLAETAGESEELVALIGYPAYDSRNDADDQARYFRDLYEVKRFAPGKIMQAASAAGQLTHDCTSLGGNSGSPLIRLETGEIVGLHFSGVYGKANSAVTAQTIRQLLEGERPVGSRLAIAQQNEARSDGHHPPETFIGREGFNTRFLKNGALTTPWPRLPAELEKALAEPSDGPSEPNELRYTHFGVKYSKDHKLPLLTAVNIDGKRSVRIKRRDDQWFTDGRIPRECQLGSENFGDLQIDRGHMVRREDPNWSSNSADAAEARQADSDTFHYVNAAAQHSSLNQGKLLWQGLENYILDSVRTQGLQACVFTGPVLRGAGDEDELVIDGAIAPKEFWKVVATIDETVERLHATAYLLSQGELLRTLMEKRSRREALEGFVLGAYRTFQVSIKDLQDATGYDFHDYVSADPLGKAEAGREALSRGEPIIVPLEKLGDIIL